MSCMTIAERHAGRLHVVSHVAEPWFDLFLLAGADCGSLSVFKAALDEFTCSLVLDQIFRKARFSSLEFLLLCHVAELVNLALTWLPLQHTSPLTAWPDIQLSPSQSWAHSAARGIGHRAAWAFPKFGLYERSWHMTHHPAHFTVTCTW